MTSVATIAQPTPSEAANVPRLENGDRLTRGEFEKRYQGMSEVKKAELIEGVVVMPSPVNQKQHGNPHLRIATWIGNFEAATPGVIGGDNATIRLDLDNEPQPDALLMIEPKHGGQAQIDEDGYISGAPELIAEIASTSASYDLHDKLNAYRRNGVREYIVWRVLDRAVDWFVLRGSEYVPTAGDEASVRPAAGSRDGAIGERRLATALEGHASAWPRTDATKRVPPQWTRQSASLQMRQSASLQASGLILDGPPGRRGGVRY